MFNKTIAELAKDLAAGKYSSEELTRAYLDKIPALDKQLNSFVELHEQDALNAARRADKQRKDGNATLLTGIPIAHKDIFCTQEGHTTCGSKMLQNFRSPYAATVVQKLAAAGVVNLGKTNMDEFAMGSSNETSFFGPVRNPWDTERVPGGSSGGSAAAVAAGLAIAATGTDTGGSIRQPAGLCNITGLKPTYGRISRYGMIAFASSLDQAGPMTRSAEDAAIMLNYMAGFDPNDSTSLQEKVPDYTATLNDSIKGLRIGLPKEFMSDKLNPQIADVIGQAVAELTKLGATVKEISLPRIDLSTSVYYVVAPAECSSNLSRFDGVRYGHRCDNPKNLEDMYKRTRGEGFGEEVKRRIMMGTYALSAGFYDAYYRKAQQLRRLISQDFTSAFKEVDVILSPTSPSVAFKLGEKTTDPISMYLSDVYTIAVNLAGLPGISIPAGFVDNLPVGLQLIGNYLQEARLLNVSHQYQQVTDHHKKTPTVFLG
jgi:aspartyl-tRNA(Asn)/glutamyl-tRNA(Gln) amidotransferase subunit A